MANLINEFQTAVLGIKNIIEEVKNTDLSKAIGSPDEQILAILNKPSQHKATSFKQIPVRRELITTMLTHNYFSKKQVKLLKALINKPLSKIDIKVKIGSKNVPSLVRDTNKRLKKYGLHLQVKIESCRVNKMKGFYKLLISPIPFS